MKSAALTRHLKILLAGFLMVNNLWSMAKAQLNAPLVTRVPRGQSQSFMFINRQAAFYFGETGGPNISSYQGFNVMTHEYLEDYVVEVNSVLLDRKNAEATVYTNKLIRTYPDPSLVEELTLADSLNVLMLKLQSPTKVQVSIMPALSGADDKERDFIVQWDQGNHILYAAQRKHLLRTKKENYPVWLGITSLVESYFIPQEGNLIASSALSFKSLSYIPGKIRFQMDSLDVFLFIVGDSREEILSLKKQVERNYESLLDKRKRRLDTILPNPILKTEYIETDKKSTRTQVQPGVMNTLCRERLVK